MRYKLPGKIPFCLPGGESPGALMRSKMRGGMPANNRIFREFIKIDIVKKEFCFIILLVELKSNILASPLKWDSRPG
jgi:hypothetical protein